MLGGLSYIHTRLCHEAIMSENNERAYRTATPLAWVCGLGGIYLLREIHARGKLIGELNHNIFT